LGGQQTAWMPRIMEGLIAILGLMFLYTLFSKRNSILGMVTPAVPNAVQTVLGGRR
jgi:heme O synthase-like polyprenyltransferase